MVDIKNITITSEILKLIAEIDEFKGRCKLSFHPSITSVNFIFWGPQVSCYLDRQDVNY